MSTPPWIWLSSRSEFLGRPQILHRDHPFHLDDPRFNIDRDLRELHASDILLRLRGFAHRPAEAAVVLAAGFRRRQHVVVDERCGLREAHAPLRVVSQFDAPAARDELSRPRS